MRRMLFCVLLLTTLGAQCDLAKAAPVVIAEDGGVNDAGNIILNWFVETEDGIGSMAVEVAFTLSVGSYVDVQGDSPPRRIDKRSDATSAEAIAITMGSDYRANNDTWYYDNFWPAENPGNNPFTGTVTNGVWTDSGVGERYFISVGSEENSGNRVPLLQMVIASGGACIDWYGIVAQGGVNNEVKGRCIPPPEPATVNLLLIGLLAVIPSLRSGR
ncbi:MAG: hypothetical protein R3E01_05720 [Pirellulaceae bacterium]|nr:hypothetical protein [Planctomycetales bacterium]